MKPITPLITILWPIALGFIALLALARYADAITRRVAPETLSRDPAPQRSTLPKTTLGWVKFVAARVAAGAAVLGFIVGPIALRYGIVALMVCVLGHDAYKRTKPLVTRGATIREMGVLILLCAVWVLSWGYFLARFAYSHHAAG